MKLEGGNANDDNSDDIGDVNDDNGDDIGDIEDNDDDDGKRQLSEALDLSPLPVNEVSTLPSLLLGYKESESENIESKSEKLASASEQCSL